MTHSEYPQAWTSRPHDPDDPRGGGGPGGEPGAYPGADSRAGPNVETGVGGYAGRDPATDMPAVPSAPETQDDPERHRGEPSEKDFGVSFGAPFGHDKAGTEPGIQVVREDRASERGAG
jgi:hypothetical protein